MSDKLDGGQAAFPRWWFPNGRGTPGMSLRVYIATAALQGICANPDCEPEDVRHNAIVALRNADALIEQLKATPKETP